MRGNKPATSRVRLRRSVLWLVQIGAFSLGCAISVTPSGGPEDKNPPTVVGTVPALDSTSVSPGSVISITFSEDMTRTLLEKLVAFSPEVEFSDVGWKGRTLKLKPEEPLHPDTTYVVTINPGFKDNHKVASKTGYHFAFATSASIDSGTISGRAFFRRKPTENGSVRCFVLPKDTSFTPESGRPDREVKTDKEGKYTLAYLPTSGRTLLVWAFEDANNNGTFNRDKEVGLAQADTVVLSGSSPVISGKDIYIVDPKEPAMLAGKVSNQTGADTVLVSVALDAVNDSTPPTYYVECDKEGAYQFKNILAGSYILRAFLDFEADSLCGTYPCAGDSSESCQEPCLVYPDTVTFEPGDELELGQLVLEPAAERTEK